MAPIRSSRSASTIRVDHPVSLYGATKRSCELMAESYSRLYGLPMTGLRFFTVYGPWGRPDMAAYLFTRAILAGEPIQVFNEGRMARDFTYIDDIVAGVVAAADRPAATGEHRIYNLGNHRPEQLLDFIGVLERLLGRTATKRLLPMQLGDVPASLRGYRNRPPRSRLRAASNDRDRTCRLCRMVQAVPRRDLIGTASRHSFFAAFWYRDRFAEWNVDLRSSGSAMSGCR